MKIGSQIALALLLLASVLTVALYPETNLEQTALRSAAAAKALFDLLIFALTLLVAALSPQWRSLERREHVLQEHRHVSGPALQDLNCVRRC